ncbi:MAG: nucleoside hydrolase [Candidatus Woesebacteria bacterium]
MKKQKILIDTDAGHDDALAMMLLLKAQLHTTLAITTVAGNSTINNVTRNAQAVLDLLGKKDIPLYSGQPTPLQRALIRAVVHGESGIDGLDVHNTIYTLTGDAPERIIKLVHQNPGEIQIITLGPLSNIARALQIDPTIADEIQEIVMMGGAINVCGNKNRVAEFNMFVDPEAADIVFRSKIPKVLVPLDPCNSIILQLKDFEQLKGSELYRPLKQMMKHFIAGITDHEGTKGALVYDAIAAYYAIRPSAFQIEAMDVIVETRGEHTFGMTIAEKRQKAIRHPNTYVVTAVDQKLFEKDLFDIIR